MILLLFGRHAKFVKVPFSNEAGKSCLKEAGVISCRLSFAAGWVVTPSNNISYNVFQSNGKNYPMKMYNNIRSLALMETIILA